jgi:putative oxidoreductase
MSDGLLTDGHGEANLTPVTVMVLSFIVAPDIAATLARIALGALFIVHGWPKIRDPKGTIGWVKGTKWPGGAVFAALVIPLEFVGGIALVVGFLSQIVAAFIALEMVGTAIFSKRQLQKKFVLGYELDVVYLVLALLVTLLGSGPWSLDQVLGIA